MINKYTPATRLEIIPGTLRADGTVFVGFLPATGEAICALPQEGRLRTFFNRFAATRHARALNAKKVAGHSDWRQPTAEEKEILRAARRSISRQREGSITLRVPGGRADPQPEADSKGLPFFDLRAVRVVPCPYEFSDEKQADDVKKFRQPRKDALNLVRSRP